MPRFGQKDNTTRARSLLVLLSFLLLSHLLAAGVETEIILYPHLAIGSGFQVVLLLANASENSWSGTGFVPGFGNGSGVPWTLNGQSMEGMDSFPIVLPARATERYVLAAREDVGPFSAALEILPGTDSEISDLASSFFYSYSQANLLIDSVGVAPGRSGTTAVFPVEFSRQSSVNTGMALRRASLHQDSPAPTLTARLFDDRGNLVQEASGEFLGARFFTEIFPAVADDAQGEFVGSLEMSSPAPIYGASLRQQLLPGGSFQLTEVPIRVERDQAVPSSARYQLTFESTWSAATHPSDFPPNPHFAGLIGAMHNDRVRFWQPSATASAGIETMAETGGKGPLNAEIQAAIDGGEALEVVSGGGIFPSPGAVQVTFTATRDFPLLTLVSMIAPSPDWFVGVHDLALFRGDDWVRELVVELLPYDAGTDSGTSCQSPNQDTQPRNTIAVIAAAPLGNGATVAPLGTFTLRRIE